MGNHVAKLIAKSLEHSLSGLPEGFHDSFDFTRTGTNLCHAVTLGLLHKSVASLARVKIVGIDVRLNRGDGIRFNPDIVGFADASDLTDSRKHVVYVDFESPNSCDARMREKDIAPYAAYAAAGETAPYVIVTSLPTRPSPRWELRWTARGQCNYAHRGNREEVRANPYRYWRHFWEDLRGFDLSSITILNIDHRRVHRVLLS